VVWNTDSNGNYVSNATGILSSANATQLQVLEGLEANFGGGWEPVRAEPRQRGNGTAS
jgi:hypothetical protein